MKSTLQSQANERILPSEVPKYQRNTMLILMQLLGNAKNSCNDKVDADLAAMNVVWQSDYDTLKTKKENWATALAKAAVEGGVYAVDEGEDETVEEAIAQITITRDTLNLEAVAKPDDELFMGNIRDIRAQMSKMSRSAGTSEYLLQAPSLGLQRYTATRQVLGKMRTENKEEEAQFKAGIWRRIVEEKLKEAKAIKIRFMEQLTMANERSEKGITGTLEYAGYGIGQDRYSKKILVDSSLSGNTYEEITIRAYKDYVLDKGLEDELAVDFSVKEGVGASYYEAKLRTLETRLAKVGKKVFGDGDTGKDDIKAQLKVLEEKGIKGTEADGELLQGMLALHVGSISSDGDSGTGEKGRILVQYYDAVEKEQQGWAEFKKPVHRKKVLDTYGMSDSNPIAAGLKETMSFSIADAAVVAAAIVGTVAGSLIGMPMLGAMIGFALNTAVNAAITAADVETGYKNGDDAWGEFAMNTAIEGAVTIGTAGLASGSGVATSFLQGAKQGAIKGAISAGGGIAKRYGHRIVSAARNGDDVWGAVEDQAELDWDTAAFAYDGLGVVTSALSEGVGGHMNGAMKADAGGDKGWQSFMVDGDYSEGVENAKNLAQGLTNSLVDYGGRRVISGAVDGWDNWEGSGMKFNLLNTRDFGMQGSSGLFELEVGGKYGLQGRIGTGGVNVSAGAMRNLGKGMDMYKLNAQLARQGTTGLARKISLSAYSSGDKEVQKRVQEMARGERTMGLKRRIAGGRGEGLTRGRHTDIVSKGIGSELAQVIGGAAIYSHEAYRDGNRMSANQQQETIDSVYGKHNYVNKAMGIFGAEIFGEAGFKHIAQEAIAFKYMDDKAKTEYINENYDSSDDYSKVVLDEYGNVKIELDGNTDWDMSSITGDAALMATLTEEEKKIIEGQEGKEQISAKAIAILKRAAIKKIETQLGAQMPQSIYDSIQVPHEQQSAFDLANNIHANINDVTALDQKLHITTDLEYGSIPSFKSHKIMQNKINNTMGKVYDDIASLRRSAYFQFTKNPATYLPRDEAPFLDREEKDATVTGTHGNEGGDYAGVSRLLKVMSGTVEYGMRFGGGGGMTVVSDDKLYAHLAYSSILHVAGMAGTTMQIGKNGNWNVAKFNNVPWEAQIGTVSNTGFFMYSSTQQVAVESIMDYLRDPNQIVGNSSYSFYYDKDYNSRHLHWEHYENKTLMENSYIWKLR